MGKILVTGGAGYVGSVLVPKLLNDGHSVVVYDALYYGADGLPEHPLLRVVSADIRDIDAYQNAVRGCGAVIHLACISNDPSFELDPGLSRSINFDCFEPLVDASCEAGVRRFIYASTSSVYGVSDAPEVTEDHPLLPITDYNKYKGMCEPILLDRQSNEFTTVIIRPATICGYSPRMRFDLAVNILTNHAVNRGVIKVFGGDQMRPNIHIDDITDLYVNLLRTPARLIAGQIFNASEKNYTIRELAEIVCKIVEDEFPDKAPIAIETTESNDPRSYHVSSRKIENQLGWFPQKMVQDAVRDLCQAFKKGLFSETLSDPRFYNVKTLKQMVLA